MNFSDYEPSELVGKIVLHESGMSYDNSRHKRITMITSVTKKGFKINKSETLFSLNSGNSLGKIGVGVISNCTLITREEADAIAKTWKENKEKATVKSFIESRLGMLDLDTLKKIQELINK